MNRTRYVVTGAGAARGRLFGRSVTEGQDLWLTEGEATTPLAQGLVLPGDRAPVIPDARAMDVASGIPVVSAAAEAPAGEKFRIPRDPLDHDGDGRKGGSLKGARHRRSG